MANQSLCAAPQSTSRRANGREVCRLEAAKTLEDAADHGTNAAVTAWHLSDWVWNAAKQNRQVLNQIPMAAGSGQLDCKKFKEWLLENLVPALKICQIITTSSKHSAEFEGEFYVQPQWVEISLVNEADEKLTFVNTAGESLRFVNASRWLIVAGGKEYPALELFKEVHKFWASFLATRVGVRSA
jgi:hypothetical protein